MINLESKIEELKIPPSEYDKYKLIQNYLREPFDDDDDDDDSINLIQKFCELFDIRNQQYYDIRNQQYYDQSLQLIKLLNKICVVS